MFNLRLIIIAVLVGATAFFVWHYVHTLEQNKRLKGEILAANTTIMKLDRKLQAEATITDDTNEIIREIHNAPETDDGPVAPVLLNTIERLHTESP